MRRLGQSGAPCRVSVDLLVAGTLELGSRWVRWMKEARQFCDREFDGGVAPLP